VSATVTLLLSPEVPPFVPPVLPLDEELSELLLSFDEFPPTPGLFEPPLLEPLDEPLFPLSAPLFMLPELLPAELFPPLFWLLFIESFAPSELLFDEFAPLELLPAELFPPPQPKRQLIVIKAERQSEIADNIFFLKFFKPDSIFKAIHHSPSLINL
jgi:hypothetical protein